MPVRFGPFELDFERRQLLRGGQVVKLTPKAFTLLRVLVESGPRALSKDELMEAVWPGVFVAQEGLPRLINEIRLAIGDSVQQPQWLRTVHGFGYAFAVDTVAAPPRRFSVSYLQHDIPLGNGQHLIGRDPTATVHVAAPVVSRRHARITIDDRHAAIEDLQSKNGTYVGRLRVTSVRELQSGDEIRIGHITLFFHTVGSTPTRTYGKSCR